ncbi:MAG TPA: hypothetical protein PLF40_24525 [Kofleriaceae bacterium]|mgnify:CR=1 FL=1|nr:hypothetical protein [Kofleriaceae bacterium]
MFKALLVFLFAVVPASAAIAGNGSDAAAAPTASAGSAAAPTASGSAAEAVPVAQGELAQPPQPAPSPADLRATCAAALNANPTFANDLLRQLDEKKVVELAKAQEAFANVQVEAGARVAKNQRHVIMAYAVMWVAAAVFVLFLWLRQRALRSQIDVLRSDLAAALKDNK